MEWDDHIACEHDPKVVRKSVLAEQLVALKLRLKLSKSKIEIESLKTKIATLALEKSLIVKKLSKSVMCYSGRRYRFLKSPKGILPTIIQTLLDKRKETRLEIKKLKDELKMLDDSNLEEAEKIKVINDLLPVLDKRQNSYKISANSMYGATGVRVGPLPFMPIAMCTTYMGRKSIVEVSKYIKDFGGSVVYGDTDCVHGLTPVLIRQGEKIFFSTIEKISKEDWSPINSLKDISSPKLNYEIWSDNQFTKINNVVRCKFNDYLSRITVHIGSVICSNNHSLLRSNLSITKPTEVKLGDNLLTSEFPLPSDTPPYPLNSFKLIFPQYVFEGMSTEVAFLLGLFFINGSAGLYTKDNFCLWSINNLGSCIAQRVSCILKTLYPRTVFKMAFQKQTRKVSKYRIFSHDECITREYLHLCYYNGIKDIPQRILLDPLPLRQFFS